MNSWMDVGVALEGGRDEVGCCQTAGWAHDRRQADEMFCVGGSLGE